MGNLLITGSGGFIGSHLTELCVEKGYDVKAFVRYNSRNNWGWLENSKYKNDIEVVSGDIRDYDSVKKAMEGCDAVFHLAALIGIPYSYVSPLAYIRTNIEGTYNVLESARHLNLKQVLVTSTSETYGSAQYVPIDEKHPLAGQSPYSATKIGADELALSYYRSFELPVKVVRPFNTYGPRQSARAIIPGTIIQILEGKKTIELGNLTPTRDFTYVNDTANGFLSIYKSDKLFGEITNIGNAKEISVSDLIKMISELAGDVTIINKDERIRPEKSEVTRLLCDNRKILENTEWTPKTVLKAGLMNTINFLKDNIHLYKSDIYNV
ncbi:MAG: GDP-mannose 4,6-dehydratase [Ignavibacteriae bacterium]|nr:GDP-mannose 4,6-dehydratase [Ignavibacteriota bacterium]